MMKQITRFSIHQSSKVLAVLSFVIVALIAIPIALFNAFYTNDWASSATMFIMPFVALIFYYIFYAIFFALYNLVAKTFGGIEFDLADKQ